MTALVALAALCAWVIPATVVAIVRDGYGQIPAMTSDERSRPAYAHAAWMASLSESQRERRSAPKINEIRRPPLI